MKKVSEAQILDAQTSAYWDGDRPCLTDAQLDSFFKKFSVKSVKNDDVILRARLNKLYGHLVFQLERGRDMPVVYGKKKKGTPKLSTIVSGDIKRMREAFDSFVSACEGLSDATKDLLTDQMIQMSSRSLLSAGNTFSGCLDKTLDSFRPVLDASAMDIEIKKGQDPVALKDAIHALAVLFWDITGKKPSRTYDGEKIDGRRGLGETGHFFEFVQTFMAFIPEAYGVNDHSLAGHIRQVCDSYRQPWINILKNPI